MTHFSLERPRLALGLVCFGITVLYVLSMLAVTETHFVPQVSDLYLIAQYARGFAEGHPFQFNPGETPTTGATSLLHTLLLALAHLMGFRGEGLVAFAVLSGACFFVLCVLQAHRAASSLCGPGPVAFVGALLVVLNGPLVWSFHYGADIALVLFLSTWLFAAWVDETPGSTAFVLPACLLALTRPEAAILVLTLSLAAVWDEKRTTGQWRFKWKWVLPPLTAVVLALALRVVAGSDAQTSFSQKLLSVNWGGFNAATFSVEYWSDLLRGVLLGFYPASQRLGLGSGYAPFYAAPFLLVLVFLAFLKTSRGLTRAGWFLFAALLTGLAVTPTIHMGVHFNRYLLFALPPLLILSALGADQAAKMIERSLSLANEVVFTRTAALACVFGALSVARFALLYADSAATVYKKDEALFEFIRTRLPEDASFLSNGISIEYQTGRRSMTLSGVATPGFSAVLPVETEASAFEILSRPETGAVPPYLIAQESYVEGSPAWRALIAGPAVFTTSSLDSAEYAIYPTRHDLVGRQGKLVRLIPDPRWTLVDSLNITDPLDERAHGYRFTSTVGTRSLYGALKIDTYQGAGPGAGAELADGGRVILGSEEWSVQTPGGGDLWLLMRTHGSPPARVRHVSGESRMELSMPESAMRISTSRGRTEWLRTALEPGWNEVALRIPSELIEPNSTRLRIEGRYASYWYAAFQAQSGRP